MKKLLGRFGEASTWAGIAGMILSISPFLTPPYHVCAQGAAAAAGALAAALREGKTS